MAHVTLLNFPANSMVGDNDAQLVAGDVAAPHTNFKGRPCLTFDDTDEAAALTPEVVMPGQYAAGTLKASIFFFTASSNADDVNFEVYVEAKTCDADTLDLEAATIWDSLNDLIETLGGTAGDPRVVTATLINKDAVAAGDLVRFGIRRDSDDATNDDSIGDVYVVALEIWEET